MTATHLRVYLQLGKPMLREMEWIAPSPHCKEGQQNKTLGYLPLPSLAQSRPSHVLSLPCPGVTQGVQSAARLEPGSWPRDY